MKTTASVRKGLHQNCDLCTYIYLFFFIYIHSPKKKAVVIAVFLSKLDCRPLFSYIYCIYYETNLVWNLFSVWIKNTTYCLLWLISSANNTTDHCSNIYYYTCYKTNLVWGLFSTWITNTSLSIAVADWGSIISVKMQTCSGDFCFLLNFQNLGSVFEKLSLVFQRLGCMFWKESLAKSLD